VASDDTPKASVAIASNTIVGNVCRYVDGVDVPDDFNAAAVNVLTDVSLYLNNNIIVGNSAPKEVADVYLTVPECVESSNTKYGIYSHSGSVNFALQPTDYCCSSADEALQCVVHALDGSVDDGVFTANLTLDGSVAPVVRIVNPVFGQKALNSLASPRFRENVVMADFNGDCQIVKATTYDRDQRGALRNMSGSASYGAFEYEAAGADAIKVVADDENAPTEYFDIRGWRVSPDNLQPGIYIRRCGSKTDKIIVSGR
ncbi:MAG: hypothetical protein ACI4A8_08275, partial [Muribaculaceae bacterium]